MHLQFNTLAELDNFLDYFGTAVVNFDKVSKTAEADITEADYNYWADQL